MLYFLSAVIVAAALGHVVFWAAVVNRVHGLGIARHAIDWITTLCAVAMGGIPLAVMALVWVWLSVDVHWGGLFVRAVVGTYLAAAAAFFVFAALNRVWRQLHPERRLVLVVNHTSRVTMESSENQSLFAPGIPSLLSRIPLNEVIDLRVHEKQLKIPRFPTGGQALRIAHISDLHMSGRILPEYFERVAEVVNSQAPHLIAITGDLVDKQKCVGWLPSTLGRLTAPGGVYYVRGNHDRRIPQEPLLRTMKELGIVHLGHGARQIEINGVSLVLAGNELPWFPPAPECSNLPPRTAAAMPLRILLAHGPDQFGWACTHDFDLMLAGHNHGGQIRLPMLGAILAPSLSGTRYASGTFRRGNTVLHVSRGTGSLTPVRWNCPPEIAILSLCADA